ncbi:MAG TPA: hypothetical protein ENI28_02875 [Roseobacter sp.]|nr:hypothetical protein [Roseobacter sp.]
MEAVRCAAALIFTATLLTACVGDTTIENTQASNWRQQTDNLEQGIHVSGQGTVGISAGH